MDLHASVSIEPATHQQVPPLIEIWKELMDFHKAIDPLFSRSTDGHTHMERRVHELIDKKDARVLVAIAGKKIVGYAIFYIQQRAPVFEEEIFGLISDLAVTAAYRRRGIGGKMVQSMVKWFDSWGIERVELQVASYNEAAYSFWKKYGFEDYKHVLSGNLSSIRHITI
jgi:ribosomal protein S18 acetylase RimI-like enzyme